MSDKMMEGIIAAAMRFVPPEIWKQIVGQIGELRDYAKSIDDRLARIEAMQGQIDALESIVRNTVPDAGPWFAERDMYVGSNIDSVAGIPLSLIQRAPPSEG